MDDLFGPVIHTYTRQQAVKAIMTIGGEAPDGGPCLTIMLPEDDWRDRDPLYIPGAVRGYARNAPRLGPSRVLFRTVRREHATPGSARSVILSESSSRP